jgi:hypothetical protein
MLQSYVRDIYPGLSSQTTSIELESIIVKDSVNLGFFDVHSPVIQRPTRTSWEEAANEILQEHAELWERLSKL